MARIMVVDDEADIRESIKTVLESLGHEAITAKDGMDCLEKLKTEKVDLVLLDFFMPEMSGREVLERIRADPKLGKLKVAMMTVARMSEAGEAAMKKLGIVDYISKPIDLADFKERLRKILGQG